MLKETLTTITLEFLKAHPEAATSLAISREEAGGKVLRPAFRQFGGRGNP